MARSFRGNAKRNVVFPKKNQKKVNRKSSAWHMACLSCSFEARIGKGEGQYYALPMRVRCVFSRNPGSLAIDVPPSEISRWRAVARVLRSPLDAIVSTVYPALCSLCGTPLPRLSVAPICDVCWMEMPLPAGETCARCGDLIDRSSLNQSNLDQLGLGRPDLDSPGVEAFSQTFPAQAHCRACSLAPPPFERAVFYGLYRGRMREAIHALKYDRISPVAKQMGRMLAEAVAQLYGDAPDELLVIPVPLHRRRHATRGFNQTQLLARHAVAALRESHPRWKLMLAPRALIRSRNTESQAGLTTRQRRINVRAAFRVSAPEAVKGKHILLVDDILTTGATARAAALVLKRAGAESVWVATLARARRDRNDLPFSYASESSIGRQANPMETAGMFLSGSPSST
jgi:ComF family protein